jgi:hypothetical protein
MEPGVTVTGKLEKEKQSQVWRMPIVIGIIAVFVLAVAGGIWQFYRKCQMPAFDTPENRVLCECYM